MAPPSKSAKRRSRREAGQAAVESALVLPLVLFMILGTLQLFMMLQARVMAEYATYRAVRAGSVNHGNCEAMNHAAIAALIPTFRRATSPAELGAAFGAVKDNTFGADYTLSSGTSIADHPIVWIYRERPLMGQVPAIEDRDFDHAFDEEPMQLQATMVYWFPMRIPFADWVIARIVMAQMGIENYVAMNPLMPAQNANWEVSGTGQPAHMNGIFSDVYTRMRTDLSGGVYVFPIRANHTMRMMTPAKQHHFQQQNCFTP